jgi:large subunit ribosomal protein L1
MAHVSKRFKAIAGKVDRNKFYSLADALGIIKETATAKFDESIDVAVNLGIDAKKSDQAVRGSVVLPAGTGKTVRVAVFVIRPRRRLLRVPILSGLKIWRNRSKQEILISM